MNAEQIYFMNSPGLEKLRVLTEELYSKDDELKLLNSFFENSLDMLCVVNKNGDFEKVNRAWEDTLGWSKSEFKNIIDCVHPDDYQSTLDAFKSLLDTKKLFYFRNRYRCQDGSYKILCWTGTVEASGIFMVARNYTGMIERITE